MITRRGGVGLLVGFLMRFSVAALLVLFTAPVAVAQTPLTPDTSAHPLASVTVTADRAPGVLGTHTATVTRIPQQDLIRQPVQHLTDALRSIPGLVVVNAGAMDEQPRLIIRGFYGGGETDYATVLMDGVPLTSLATGLANWDIVPVTAVRAIEVVRGSSSALYGDAAVGGVINILTVADIASSPRWRFAAGEYGSVDGSGAWSASHGERHASLFGGYRRASGYRDHERGDATSIGGSVDLFRSDRASLSLSALHHGRDYDDPGPLPAALVGSSPRTSAPFFRYDANAEQLRRLSLRGSTLLGGQSSLSGYVTGESLSGDLTRTLQLSPDFSDTRTRSTRARRVMASTQVVTDLPNSPWPQRFVIGTDVSFGNLLSEYRPLVSGDASTYVSPGATAGDVDARGRGNRDAYAAFAHWENTVLPRLRIVVGGRVDWMRDVYRGEVPADAPHSHSNRRAFSPKLGMNFNYLENESQSGHAYFSLSRSFKAPTLDQLFDQRPIPIPFPPFSVTISNPDLRPQRGSAVEAGLSHRAAVASGRTLDFSVAAFRQEMRDELDFDIAQFRYVNVGRSLHKGIELGVRAEATRDANVFASMTSQRVVAMNGANEGRQLKAVPKQVLSAGVSAGPSRLQGSVTISDIRGAYLDDANARRLPAYTRVDTRLSSAFGSLRVNLDVLNALDRKLVSTGFPDGSGTDVAYYYPAARRIFQVGVGSGW
ncbi:MAG TPA: TonB-dependent receptor [Gemmatimonadaceae bacterium]